jgi:prepilin-type processing-associated H-X9-DG protein
VASGGRLSEPHGHSQNIAYLDGHVARVAVKTLSYPDWLVSD